MLLKNITEDIFTSTFTIFTSKVEYEYLHIINFTILKWHAHSIILDYCKDELFQCPNECNSLLHKNIRNTANSYKNVKSQYILRVSKICSAFYFFSFHRGCCKLQWKPQMVLRKYLYISHISKLKVVKNILKYIYFVKKQFHKVKVSKLYSNYIHKLVIPCQCYFSFHQTVINVPLKRILQEVAQQYAMNKYIFL